MVFGEKLKNLRSYHLSVKILLSGIFWMIHFVRLLCKWNQFEFINFYFALCYRTFYSSRTIHPCWIKLTFYINVLVCRNFEPFETNTTSQIKAIISLQKWEWVQIPCRLLNDYLRWIKYGVIISLQESRRLDSPLKLAGFPKSFHFSRSHSCFYEMD